MQKILIVNKSFETGGIQSSMVNMANELSRYYEVDLLIYNPHGPMLERLDEKVNVISADPYLKALCMSPRQILRSGKLKTVMFGGFAIAWTKLFNNKKPIEIAIKHQKRLTGYDLAI